MRKNKDYNTSDSLTKTVKILGNYSPGQYEKMSRDGFGEKAYL